MAVENAIFLSEIVSGFGEPGGTHPLTRIPRSTPSGDQEQGVNHVTINIA